MNNGELRRLAQKALTCFVNRQRETPPWAGRKIVIYGAGGFGRDIAAALRRRSDAMLLGFLDQRGSGQTVFNDLGAHPLESAAARQWLAEKAVVIIGVHNASGDLRKVKSGLTRFGFSTTVLPMEAYLHLRKELGWRYWLGTPEDYSLAAMQIEQTRNLWADQESERLFLQTLLFRLQFDLAMAPVPMSASMQYADASLPPWPEPLRMVDGGAYTGDTLASLHRRGYQFGDIHAFEPDAENFQMLRTTVSTLTPETRISLWPCGLWSSTGRMKFIEDGAPSSKLSDSGSSLVPVVALDDVLHGQPVNLIKLDVEGAEPEALRGARGLIEKYRPGLAVCLYHHPHHLWSIPLWVKELNLGYQLYYRPYGHNTFETVLYAIPEHP